MASLNYPDHESDRETIQQTETIQQPIVTLEYLLNQNKMKQIALSKATHLIELYKIELQVKQQDYNKELDLLRQSMKQNYQSLISTLEDKIIRLEKQLKHQENKIQSHERRQSESYELEKLNESLCRIPKMSRNNSGRDLSNNRKGRFSQSKNLTTQPSHMKRSLSILMTNEGFKQQQLYRIQKSFLIQYLLRSEQKDEKIISELQNGLSTEEQIINQIKGSIKGNQKFMQLFLKQLKQPSAEIEDKIKEYREIIKIQELIIEEMNGQLAEYEDLFVVMNQSLEQIFQKQSEQTFPDEVRFSMITTTNSLTKNETSFDQFRNSIHDMESSALTKIRQYKNFIRQKITNMEAQNKELKRIMDDMIKLIKNNKKIQAVSYGNIRNIKTNEDYEMSKEKIKSQTLNRK